MACLKLKSELKSTSFERLQSYLVGYLFNKRRVVFALSDLRHLSVERIANKRKTQ